MADDWKKVAEVLTDAHKRFAHITSDADTKLHIEKELKAAEDAAEQKTVTNAQHVLESVKANIRSAIGSLSNPEARSALEQVLKSLDGATINSIADVRVVQDLVTKADSQVREAQGMELQQALGNIVMGVVAAGEALASPFATGIDKLLHKPGSLKELDEVGKMLNKALGAIDHHLGGAVEMASIDNRHLTSPVIQAGNMTIDPAKILEKQAITLT